MSVTELILSTAAKAMAKFFGSANDRELKRLWPLVEKVNLAWEQVRRLDDASLQAKTAEFRRRLLKGETEDQILPEAYAVCREAAHRTLGQKRMVPARHEQLVSAEGKLSYRKIEGEIPLFAHFDVQILGGIVLHQGKIAEMVTGEGKTLVATLPTYLNALRVTDEWRARAEQDQGADPERWVFKPYGLYRDGEQEIWRRLDRLVPDPADVTYRPPERYLAVSRGVHVITVNDYLAKRDAEYNRPLFEFLGLMVGAIQSNMENAERQPIYNGDVTYGTNNEFGFDYLRDNLKARADDQVQRSRHFAIVDEVDSVLIDEARTPLIISGMPQESTDKYYQADRIARKLQGGDMNRVEEAIAANMREGWQREDARLKAEEEHDFVFSERDHTAKLTERGMHQVLRLLGTDDIYSGENLDMPHYIDNALKAHALYHKDHHYIVKDGHVYIVDEFTGRVLEGRRWSDGLHQAVEAKEHLRIKEESQTVATITFQNFFRLYKKLAGMTGTAMTEAKEFDRIYKLGVVSIPTNRPLRRINYPDLIYGTEKEKYQAIAEHVAEIHATGQPILIGTVSIARSEIISELLTRRGIPHEVLNAKHHAREAEIVAQAGRFGAVTIATNMAGRGTDIVLGEMSTETLLEHWQKWRLTPKKGVAATLPKEQLLEVMRPIWVEHYLEDLKPEYGTKTPAEWDKLLKERWREYGMVGPTLTNRVAEMGGLHIVGTERHEARRIDNQLRGRSGRQGDPGSSRFFLSLEDDTMRMFAPERVANILRRMGLSEGIPLESRMVTRTVENAQRKVEERNFEIRRNLLEYDQVMNEQRLVIYERRQKWLEGRELRESMFEFCENHVTRKVDEQLGRNAAEWDLPALCRFMADTFLVEVTPAELEAMREQPDPPAAIDDLLRERLADAYGKKEERLGSEMMRMLEKFLLLEIMDRKWMDHLYAMDLLKEGIHLWGYAGQDPKIRYKREGYELFEELWDSFQAEVSDLVMKVAPVQEVRPAEQVKIQATVHDDFNDPCPCGSGKKYKKCCGRG